MPTQFKVAPVGKSHSVLDFKADIIVGFDAGPKIDEIIYDLEVMIVDNNVAADDRLFDGGRYFVLSSFPTEPIRFASLSSLEKEGLTAQIEEISR